MMDVQPGVAPFAGAWIETAAVAGVTASLGVAPFAGAWIETVAETGEAMKYIAVAPFAGAWIETLGTIFTERSVLESLPSRGRGLKRRESNSDRNLCIRRSLRGSVD